MSPTDQRIRLPASGLFVGENKAEVSNARNLPTAPRATFQNKPKNTTSDTAPVSTSRLTSRVQIGKHLLRSRLLTYLPSNYPMGSLSETSRSHRVSLGVRSG